MTALEKRIILDNVDMLSLLGSNDANLKLLEDRFNAMITFRGENVIIKGVKETWIIDDTYNASPQSSKTALDILAEIPATGDKIAVFGDMLELGSASEEGHKEVGREVFRLGIDYLYVVGERSRDIARGAREAGRVVLPVSRGNEGAREVGKWAHTEHAHEKCLVP